MQRNKLILSMMILLSWFTCFSAFAQSAAVQGDPVALLKYIADNMIRELKANQATLKTKPSIVYSLANRYVVPYADVDAMSKRVLPPATWNGASAVQREQFKRSFTTTLIRTYSSALAAYKDQVVQFYPVRGGASGSSVEVNSEIDSASGGEPIHVTYRMLRVGSVWRLYDMSVEGVSMIDSFRSQFSDILSTGNMEQLLSRLTTHNTGAR